MPANLLKNRGGVLVASVTKVATFSSGWIFIPQAESYLFILDCTAASGTSPTLDVALQVSIQDEAFGQTPTTGYSVMRFAQVTTTSKLAIRMQPTLGRGEAASAITCADTGGSLVNNIPLGRQIQFKCTIGGTNPSFTFTIGMLCVPKQAGTY